MCLKEKRNGIQVIMYSKLFFGLLAVFAIALGRVRAEELEGNNQQADSSWFDYYEGGNGDEWMNASGINFSGNNTYLQQCDGNCSCPQPLPYNEPNNGWNGNNAGPAGEKIIQVYEPIEDYSYESWLEDGDGEFIQESHHWSDYSRHYPYGWGYENVSKPKAKAPVMKAAGQEKVIANHKVAAKKPVKIMGKPVKVMGKPVKVMGKPVEVMGKPVKIEAKSVKIEGKPIKAMKKPIKIEAKSVKVEGRPVKIMAKPAKKAKSIKVMNQSENGSNQSANSQEEFIARNHPLKRGYREMDYNPYWGSNGGRCVVCPYFRPRCDCPYGFRCVYVPRTCFRCQQYVCARY